MNRAAQISACHRDEFGRPPDVISFAPGRVNLMGDHTDYNGGAVLPTAIGLGTVCGIARRRDGWVRAVSRRAGGAALALDPSAFDPDVDRGWVAYVAGAVLVARQRGWWTGGVDLTVDGDLPLGAGLSSSASLICAILTALVGAERADADPMAIAQAAQQVEHDYARVPCGIMDQATSMLARPGTALLLDTATLDHQHVPLPLDDLGLDLLVIDTRVRHSLGDGGYAERRAECEEAARRLGVRWLADLAADDDRDLTGLPDPLRRRARHVASEHARVAETAEAFRAGDTAALGVLFAQSHRSLADDFDVSCAELDLAVSAAVSSGASAARMTGAGFGGSVLALCPRERSADVRAGVARAFQGRRSPGFTTVRPAGGARLLGLDPGPG